MSKKFILNADDFGLNEAANRAVSEGYLSGILKSASLVPNGDAFAEAVNQIIPACPELGIGVHLNIMEGKSLIGGLDLLTDENRVFNNSYVGLLKKSVGKHHVEFLEQLEKEFRAQIESVLDKTRVSHIDSHVHIHSIPRIFNLVCKLADKYKIKQVRTQYEKPYLIPDLYAHINMKFPVNLVKVALLNFFTQINRRTLKNYELHTNDYLIGVTYTSMMSSLAVACGLSVIKDKSCIAEALIHPRRYEEGIIDNHFTEFQITRNAKLKEKITSLGFEITNYKELLYFEES